MQSSLPTRWMVVRCSPLACRGAWRCRGSLGLRGRAVNSCARANPAGAKQGAHLERGGGAEVHVLWDMDNMPQVVRRPYHATLRVWKTLSSPCGRKMGS